MSEVSGSRKSVVIGAGIIGASVACHLAKNGADVTLLDANDPASGTTSRSFAWVNANNKTPKQYFDLNVAGMRENRILQGELDANWLHETGNTIVSEDSGATKEKIERLTNWGYDARLITSEEARDTEPRFDPDAFPDASIAYFPGESWADAPLATRTITEAASSLGAEVRTKAEVVGIEPGEGVTLSDGETIAADVVVNAAGPDGANIARMVGREVPLDVFPGLIVRISAPDNPLNGLLHTPLVNLRPDGDGFVAAHHDSVDAMMHDTVDLDELAEELLQRAKKIIPSLEDSEVVELRPGRRPVPGDGYSSVGGLQGISGYYECLTHSGVTLGPLLGRLLAAEILTGDFDPLLEGFRPDRF